MSYLVSQIWFFLLVAAILGFLIGIWFKTMVFKTKIEDMEADWHYKVGQVRKEATAEAEANLAPKTDFIEPANVGLSAIPTRNTRAEKTSYPIEEVEGIGASYAKKLRQLDVSTTQQLLDRCMDQESRMDVAQHVGIEDFVVQKWASMSDLMRVGGIEGQFAELMAYAGIESTQVLATQIPHKLEQLLQETNSTQKRVKKLPDIHVIDLMIRQAKALPEVLQEL